MSKNLILEDSFEKLAEQGTTQAKKAVKSVVQQVKPLVNPNKLWEQILGLDSNPSIPSNSANPSEKSGVLESDKKGNHTPLNLEKLGKKYRHNEQQESEALKQRLFQLVKRGEEQALEEGKKEKEEKKRQELYEAQEKKRKEQDRIRQEQSAEAPKGKVRRSIFSHKKVAERQHAELKPSTGKQ